MRGRKGGGTQESEGHRTRGRKGEGTGEGGAQNERKGGREGDKMRLHPFHSNYKSYSHLIWSV